MKKVRNILLIRFSSIGDVVLTSALIRCIYEQIPDVRISFLTKEAYREVLQHNPCLYKIYTFKNALKEVLPDLKSENFDHVLDLHNNLRSRLTTLSLSAPVVRLDKQNLRKWRMVKTKSGERVTPVVLRYLDTAAHLKVNYDGKGLDYFLPPDISLPYLPFAKFIAVVTGGKFKTKCLPLEKLKEVCMQSTLPIVVLGGKEETETGKELERLFAGKVYSLCGTTNLTQSAYILQLAKGVITNDTGLMHISCAFKKPMVLFWGNTTPAIGFAPVLPEGLEKLVLQKEVKELNCRPCSKLGYTTCPEKHFKCMNLQDTSFISKWTEELS